MANDFSYNITAVDNSTKVIRQINSAIAGVKAPTEKLVKEINKFGELSGLKRITQGFKDMAKEVQGLSAFTGIASVAGLAQIVQSWAQYGQGLQNASIQTGVAASRLQNLQNAGRLAGVSVESLTGSYQALGKSIYDAIGGRNADAMGMFNQLHIQFQDGNHKAADVQKTMEAIADQVAARKGNPQAEQAILSKFGISMDMLPLLERGAAGMRALEAQAKTYGGVTDDNVGKASELQTAFTAAQEAAEGFSHSFASSVGPTVKGWLDVWTSDVVNMSSVLNEATTAADLKAREAALPPGKKAELQALRQRHAANANIQPASHGTLGQWLSDNIPGAAALDKWLDLPGTAARMGQVGTGAAGAIPGPTALGKAIIAGLAAKPMSLDQQRRAAGLPTSIGGGASQRSQAAMAYFMAQGWTKAQSAGPTANIGAESGFNPFAVGDHGHAYGLGQWQGPRQQDYLKLFGHTMQSVKDAQQAFREQLEFYQHELAGGGDAGARRAGRMLHGATTGQASGEIVSRFDERPGARDDAARNRGAAAELLASGGGGGSDGRVQVDTRIRITHDGRVQTASHSQANGAATASAPRVDTAMVFA